LPINKELDRLQYQELSIRTLQFSYNHLETLLIFPYLAFGFGGFILILTTRRLNDTQ